MKGRKADGRQRSMAVAEALVERSVRQAAATRHRIVIKMTHAALQMIQRNINDRDAIRGVDVA